MSISISSAFGQLSCLGRRVVELHAPQRLVGGTAPQDTFEAFPEVDGRVVQHQMESARSGVDGAKGAMNATKSTLPRCSRTVTARCPALG